MSVRSLLAVFIVAFAACDDDPSHDAAVDSAADSADSAPGDDTLDPDTVDTADPIDGADADTTPPPPIDLAMIPAEGEVVAIGGTKNLTGTVKADGNAVEGQTVEFSSSDANILKIENGVATGVAAGAAKIMAKSGSLTAELNVTVGDAAPAADPAAAGAK